jgi:phosphoribosylaminoimidazole-succinocarboxamide synthase
MKPAPDTTLYHSQIPHLPLLHRGKVRDLYAIDDEHLLMVTTDRLSAFDVVLPTPIPGKGAILTAITRFWMQQIQDTLGIPHHLSGRPLSSVIADPVLCAQLEPRSLIVRRLRPLPIEAIVRGYLIGSGWKDYQRDAAVCGIALPAGLRMADALPEPLFTPSTKAAVGEHDTNIPFATVVEQLGAALAEQVRTTSLRIFQFAEGHARARGILIADTKLEFGLDADDRLVLIDEVLTPDSSRFWPLERYQPGSSPDSFDKQFVRDYLETLDWNKRAPGPELPTAVVQRTATRYAEALHRLTGPPLAFPPTRYPGTTASPPGPAAIPGHPLP